MPYISVGQTRRRKAPVPRQPSDLHIYVLVSTVLGAAALAAMVLPAVRASRVDPVTTLRAE